MIMPREGVMGMDDGLGDYEKFPDDSNYHSDSAIPPRDFHVNPPQRVPIPVRAPVPEVVTRRSAKETSRRNGPVKKDLHSALLRLDNARVRKARKKHIARAQRDEDEVRLFRGTVSCICTCMELQTEKLLPALREEFEKRSRTRSDSDLDFKQAAGGVPEQAAASGKKDSEQTPLRNYLKGEWKFKMYTDVLHAHATFEADEFVNAAKAEMKGAASKTRDIEMQTLRKLRKTSQGNSPPGHTVDMEEKILSHQHDKDLSSENDPQLWAPVGSEGLEPPPLEGRRIKRVVSNQLGEAMSDGETSDVMQADDEDGYLQDADSWIYREGFEAEIQQAAATVSDLATKHVFCYEYGCLVFWGLEPEEEQFFINFVKDFEDDPIPDEGQERDDMTFFYGTRTRLYNDQVQLATNSPLEKLSISFALAQSTKLSVLELRVEETFENTRAYPQELAETGQISLSQTEVSKLIGQLFIVRASVNLESDMLSTPDFFWENDEWEPIFRHAGKYLEIDGRVGVLNKRMEVLDGMFQMLKDQLEVRHATRLEWIVIWLIVAEVGLELVWNILIHDILGFFNRCD
uniref:DUF155 domain-containing protein n=1 Tax=Guillardia theta TaxID=55529 RepID=A0A7S4MZV6_GUITH